MNISNDALAMILICSHLGLGEAGDVSPFTLSKWNPFADKVSNASLRPGNLLGMSAADLMSRLELAEKEAGELLQLLERSGTVAIALEHLASLGIHVLTRADAGYPQRYKSRLAKSAPPVLFYSGDHELLGQPGIAVVGSRNLDETGQNFATFVGNVCGLLGRVLYSGGARGVDSLSMAAALSTRNSAVGVLADSLEATIRKPEYRSALQEGNLCLVTPYAPNAHFSIGNAMGRNKLIYALADQAIVVSSDAGKGGTWAGATEALKARWLPVFVLQYPEMPAGNQQLIQKGALPLPNELLGQKDDFIRWLDKENLPGKTDPPDAHSPRQDSQMDFSGLFFISEDRPKKEK